jgi:transcriptional accessory protein Tex/SPT6
MTEELNQEFADPDAHPSDTRDLRPKMKLRGAVSRVELFGAFVDIGVGQDGLVHISQLRDGQVNRVADVVSVGDEVTVWVTRVDLRRGRISLTMIEPPERTLADLEPGMVLTGKVSRLARFGVFVDIGVERDGLVHVSEIAQGYVRDPAEYVSVGEEVEVRVVSVDLRKKQIELSMKDLPTRELGQAEEEGEESVPTTVELALKEAMSQSEQGVTRRSRRKRPKEIDDERAEVLARTLRVSKNEK